MAITFKSSNTRSSIPHRIPNFSKTNSNPTFLRQHLTSPVSFHRRHKKGSNEEDLSRIPSLDLTPEQGMAAVAEETVVPTGPEHNQQDDGINMSQDAEASQAHIYFKDLKLLAHDTGDSEEEEEVEEQPLPAKQYSPLADEVYDPGSAATSPMADGTVRKN